MDGSARGVKCFEQSSSLHSSSQIISFSGRRCPNVFAKSVPVLRNSACCCHQSIRVDTALYIPSLFTLHTCISKYVMSVCRSFVSTISAIPTQIMAVSEADGASVLYMNELTQSLLMEGHAIADRLRATFQPVNTSLHQQSTYMSVFTLL